MLQEDLESGSPGSVDQNPIRIRDSNPGLIVTKIERANGALEGQEDNFMGERP